MKPGTDQPDEGQVVQTTTTRRVLPPKASKDVPVFWEYYESLSDKDNGAGWEHHVLYIYRDEPGPPNQIEKCTNYLVMPNGERVEMADQESLEYAIARKWGGKQFRLILKGSSGYQRITSTKIFINLPPKFPSMPGDVTASVGTGPTVTPAGETSAMAEVAKTSIATMAGQDKQAIDVAVNAIRGAAEVVQRFGGKQTDSNPILDRFMEMAMQRLLTPVDPMDTLTKFLALVRELNGGAAAAAPGGDPFQNVTRTLEFLRGLGFNPQASGQPATNASAELVRQLPSVASHVASAITEWRMGMEAQRDTAAMMSGRALPAKTAPPAPTTTGVQVQRPNPAEASPAGVPSFEFVEAKILEILQEPISSEEAADEAIAFLARIDRKAVTELAKLGEQGLLQFFQTRPTLKPALANVPRLQEFIRAFLKFANEPGEPDDQAAGIKPN